MEDDRGDSAGSWMAQVGKATTEFRSRQRKQLTSQHEIRFCATQILIAVRFSLIVVPWYAATRTSWANARRRERVSPWSAGCCSNQRCRVLSELTQCSHADHLSPYPEIFIESGIAKVLTLSTPVHVTIYNIYGSGFNSPSTPAECDLTGSSMAGVIVTRFQLSALKRWEAVLLHAEN